MRRRNFLRGLLATGATMVAAGAGMFYSLRAWAGARPDGAFLTRDIAQVLTEALGISDAVPSDQIKIDAPLQAENGAFVPVKIATTLPAPEAIAVVVPVNPTPLLTVMETTPRTGSYYALRIKMAETGKIFVYVKSGGRLHSATQDVRIAVGGCGG